MLPERNQNESEDKSWCPGEAMEARIPERFQLGECCPAYRLHEGPPPLFTFFLKGFLRRRTKLFRGATRILEIKKSRKFFFFCVDEFLEFSCENCVDSDCYNVDRK